MPAPLSGFSHVRMNFVASIDGAATVDGRSGALGGTNDRAIMQVLRSLCDAVMVGAGTVRAEGYGGLNLTEPHQQRREKLGLTPVPTLVVVTASLRLNPSASVFTRAETRPIIVTHAAAEHAAGEAAVNALAEVAELIIAGETEVDLAQALRVLRERGLTRVLCEGGPELFSSLLEDDLVDEVCLTVSPVVVGGDARRITHPHHPTDAAASAAFDSRRFTLAHVTHDDEGFVFLRYARASSVTPALGPRWSGEQRVSQQLTGREPGEHREHR